MSSAMQNRILGGSVSASCFDCWQARVPIVMTAVRICMVREVINVGCFGGLIKYCDGICSYNPAKNFLKPETVAGLLFRNPGEFITLSGEIPSIYKCRATCIATASSKLFIFLSNIGRFPLASLTRVLAY